MSKLDAFIYALRPDTELRRILEAVREDMGDCEARCAFRGKHYDLCARRWRAGKKCGDCPLHEHHAATRAALGESDG